MGKSVAERFWNKVDKGEHKPGTRKNRCWLWTGAITSRGYGSFTYKPGKNTTAHRVAWYLTHGEMPAGHICHKCVNKRCVNPDHLFWGSAAENALDAQIKGRKAKRLSAEQVLEIRARYSPRKVTMEQLAREYDVSSATIYYVVSRKTWAHIP